MSLITRRTFFKCEKITSNAVLLFHNLYKHTHYGGKWLWIMYSVKNYIEEVKFIAIRLELKV